MKRYQQAACLLELCCVVLLSGICTDAIRGDDAKPLADEAASAPAVETPVPLRAFLEADWIARDRDFSDNPIANRSSTRKSTSKV